MLNINKKMRNEKGQGLTEYVLLLAFIAAIAFMLNSGGLLGTVKGSYNETQGIFAMLFGDNSRPDWGHADVSTFNEKNSAERLARDQEALVNLANYFIGKKKKDVKAVLSVPGHLQGYSGDNEDVVLGRIYRNDDGGTDFNSLAINENYSPYIYNWMQGDYGTNGSYNLSYDATNKYLVSDYALENGWTGTSDGGTWDNGIHVRLQYDNNKNNLEKTVIGAKITIDPKRQGSTSGEGSGGLEVTVRKDGTSEVTYTQNSATF